VNPSPELKPSNTPTALPWPPPALSQDGKGLATSIVVSSPPK